MDSQINENTSRWFIYTFTAILGITFTITLFTITWNNAVDSRKKDISYELSTIKQTIAHNILVSNNVINNLAAFFHSNPEPTEKQFNIYAKNLGDYYSFIENIVYFQSVNQGQKFPVQFEVSRGENIFLTGQDIYSDIRFKTIIEYLLLNNNPLTISSVINNNDTHLYGIYRVLLQDDLKNISKENIIGIVSVFANPNKFLDKLIEQRQDGQHRHRETGVAVPEIGQ